VEEWTKLITHIMHAEGIHDIEVLVYGSVANGLSIKGSSSDIDTSLQISTDQVSPGGSTTTDSGKIRNILYNCVRSGMRKPDCY
jgi:hypothetical protein